MSIVRLTNPGAKQEVHSIFHDLDSIKSQHQKVRTLNGSVENRLHFDNGSQSVDYCCDGETPEEKAKEIIQAIPWFIGDLIGRPIKLTVEKESEFIIVEKPEHASVAAFLLSEFLEEGYYSPSNKDGETVQAFKLPNPNLEKYQAIDIEKKHPNFFSYATRILEQLDTEKPCLAYDWSWNSEGILFRNLGYQLQIPLIFNMSLAIQKEPPNNAICYLDYQQEGSPYSFINSMYGYRMYMLPDPGKIISWDHLMECVQGASNLE
jgi:hypothetical protein